MGCMKRFRPEADGTATVLGPLESAVLNALWEIDSMATVGDVVDRLADTGQSVHYSSVKTTLNTLVAKGCVKKQPFGRANAFSAAISPADFGTRVVEGVVGGLLRNYRNPLLLHLAQQLADDDESLEEFERLIAQARGGE